jgi:lipopolysaccharide/colanic/teichoic acid biosynthesis glycosyltransferase
MKRALDLVGGVLGLIVFAPVLVPCSILVWWGDRHSPLYIAERMGKGEIPFQMIKLRSMVVGADRSGVDSTSASDARITPVGRFIRRYKLDELAQLLNVVRGDMSLVGPRPNVRRETDLYTTVEKKLLTVRPGITDLASIVFADENEILVDSEDPDLDYNQLIRPWKSRIGLAYVENANIVLDLRIIWLTAMGIASRKRALRGVSAALARLGCDEQLVSVATRTEPLMPFPPPGAHEIVQSR